MTQDIKDKIQNNIFRLLPTDQDKITYIETILGCGLQMLTEFTPKQMFKFTDETRYSIAILLTNTQVLIDGNAEKFIDFSDYELPTKQKLIEVLKHLIEIYKDELAIE